MHVAMMATRALCFCPLDAFHREKGDEDRFTVDGVAATVHRPCLDTASDIVTVSVQLLLRASADTLVA